MFLKFLAVLVSSCLYVGSALAFDAQKDTLKIVVPFQPGGISDVLGRIVEGGLQKRGIKTEMMYKPGANGVIGAAFVANADPNEHIVGVVASGQLTLSPLLEPNLVKYDVDTSFSYLSRIGKAPLVFIGSSRFTGKTLADVFDMSRKETLKCGNPSTSMYTPTAYMFKYFNTSCINVPYKGTAPGRIDIIGGHIDLMMDGPEVLPMAQQGGKFSVLAVTSKNRLKEYPNIPTLSETIPGLSVATYWVMVAPAKMPVDVVNALRTEINAAIESAEAQKAFTALYVESLPTLKTESAIKEYVAAETKIWVMLLDKLK